MPGVAAPLVPSWVLRPWKLGVREQGKGEINTGRKHFGQCSVDCVLGVYFSTFCLFFCREGLKNQNVLTATSIIKQCTHINIHQNTPNIHQQTRPWPKNGRFRKLYTCTCRCPIWPVAWAVINSPLAQGLGCLAASVPTGLSPLQLPHSKGTCGRVVSTRGYAHHRHSAGICSSWRSLGRTFTAPAPASAFPWGGASVTPGLGYRHTP